MDTVIDVGQFDERYEHKASEGGKYPINTDFNNIFHIGFNYGKRRFLGTEDIWSSDKIQTINGYPKYSEVFDENYNLFVSATDNNTSALPKEGETSSIWIPMEAKAGFNKKYEKDNFDWYPVQHMKFDIERPKGYQTSNFMVKKFSGKDINLSGMIIFLNADYTGGIDLVNRVLSINTEEDENGLMHGSFKMKISTYPDIYENTEHVDSYVELMSYESYVVHTNGNSYNKIQTKSDQKPFPISWNQTYYLYMELENVQVNDAPTADPNRPFGCTYLSFPRTLSWPGAGKF
ncbi:MAG: hypothetical protein J6Q22_10905 [Prevotella sp.]|nr:hypothetical protein [Prevotella sp.]